MMVLKSIEIILDAASYEDDGIVLLEEVPEGTRNSTMSDDMLDEL